jgi:hypothetical protein
MTGGAEFDATGLYRYRLWREWDPSASRVAFIMLNPSQADAERNDATIRRCIGFARLWGCGSLEAVNLFAFRTPYPARLREAEDPVGCGNDEKIREATERASLVVAAWGNGGAIRERDRAVLALLGKDRSVHCLGLTKTGRPRHPLHLSARTPLVPFRIESPSEGSSPEQPNGIPDFSPVSILPATARPRA